MDLKEDYDQHFILTNKKTEMSETCPQSHNW